MQPSSEILWLFFIGQTSSVCPGLKWRIRWCWKREFSFMLLAGDAFCGAVRCRGASQGLACLLIPPSAGVNAVLDRLARTAKVASPHQACNYIWGRKAQGEEGIWTVCAPDLRWHSGCLALSAACHCRFIHSTNTSEHDKSQSEAWLRRPFNSQTGHIYI